MNNSWLPSQAEMDRAIGIYTTAAYGERSLPAAVQQRLAALHEAGAEFWEASVLEKSPGGFSLRLGNPWYPHMKLAVEQTPDGKAALFRVDTHDRHIQPPPQSPDYAALSALQQRNMESAQGIESAWADAGLLTFKEYLRRDLERRAASTERRAAPPGDAPSDAFGSGRE